MATLKELKDKRDSLVVVPTDLAILAKPWEPGRAPITTITDSTGALLDFAAQGYEPAGEIEQKAGVDMSPDVKFSDILGYGSRNPRRRIKQSQSFGFDFTAQEIRKITAMIANSLTADQFVVDSDGNWSTRIDSSGNQLYWDVLAIAFDGAAGSEIYPWWWYPKMGVDKPGKKKLEMDNALTEPISLTAFEDDENGLYYTGMGGTGWHALSAAAGFGAVAQAPYTVTIGGSPTGGTFTLTIGSQTTSAIAYNATASAVQSALAALSSVGGSSHVQVTGSAGGPYAVAFDATVLGTLTGSGANLTPSGTVTISQ